MAINQIDHLMYAVADLDEGIERFYELTGVRAQYGGAHENMGTCNALLSLGNHQYVELIAPDTAQKLDGNLGAILKDANRDGLRSWAIATTSLADVASSLNDFHTSAITDMARVTTEGQRLQWQLMFLKGESNLPFFIDWQDSPHPSLSAPQGCSLLSLTVSGDTPERLNTLKSALDIAFNTKLGEHSLCATIQTPKGEVKLLPW